MGFWVVPQDVKTFEVSLAVTKPLNVDFDGDEIDCNVIPKNVMPIQWNLSKADTYGTEDFVRFREVSALESFELKSFQI